jgi:hypothetical protein
MALVVHQGQLVNHIPEKIISKKIHITPMPRFFLGTAQIPPVKIPIEMTVIFGVSGT